MLLSTAVAWEIAIKIALGKLAARPRLVAELVGRGGVELAMTVAHADAAGALPLHHRDPFDRMLVAQARVERLTLVSHDRRLEPYGGAIIWA